MEGLYCSIAVPGMWIKGENSRVYFLRLANFVGQWTTPSTSSRYCTCARVRTAISKSFPGLGILDLGSTLGVQYDVDSVSGSLTLASKFLNYISIRNACHPFKLTEISWEILAPSAVTSSSTNLSRAVLRARGPSTFSYRNSGPDAGF